MSSNFAGLAENEKRVEELLDRKWRMLIDGKLTEALSGDTFAVTSPYTGGAIAQVPDGGPADGDQAVQAAQQAFPGWRALPAGERAVRVQRIADAIEAHAHDLALLDAIDGGAPIAEMSRDLYAAAGIVRYFAGLALEIKGSTVPASENLHFTQRQPYGVVVKIIPFNHPVLFAVSKIAAPLIAGNTVVLKPAEATPLSALLLSEIVQDLLPPGVLNIVVGNGPQLPETLVRHPLVHRIGFTGSERTGRRILISAAETGVKEVSLELGGKNALIAFPDASVDEVVKGAVNGMNFTWSGQSCGSTSRLLVHEDIADQVVAGIVRSLAGRTIASPLDPASEQGTMVSRPQYDRVLSMISTAQQDGAQLVTGGRPPQGVEPALFIAPTVLDHVAPDSYIAQEEVFGPVLSVIRWRKADEAIQIANSVRYGLTASVYTNDVRRAHKVAAELDAGYVWINGSSRHFIGLPYGGFKASGLGREESIDELLSYTQLKAINVLL